MSVILASLRELCERSPLLNPSSGPLCVLLVEDHERDAARVEALILDVMPDAEVRRAGLGAEALSLLEGVDVTLLDLKLPDMTGRVWLGKAQAARGPDAFACVAMSLRGTELDASEILRAGAHDYVLKDSLSHDRLMRALEVSLDLSLSRRRARFAYEELSARTEALARETERRRLVMQSVAHHLRSPLQVLSLAGAELKESAMDPERKEAASLVLAAYRRMSRLVESLDAAHQVEGGQVSLVAQRVDVVSLVRRLVEELRNYPRGALLDLDEDVCGPLDAVLDRRSLEQILVHLCVNAMRHAEDEVRVWVEERGNRLRLQVVDDGPGVPPEDRDRIFLAFDRGSQSEHRPGVGLGLSLARGLTEAMAGTLTLESGPSGARFIVDLPRYPPGSEPGGEDDAARPRGQIQSDFAS